MGQVHAVHPVTPVLGVLYAAETVLDDALMWVEHVLGDVELASESWPFADTDYYTAEMGDGLKRRFYGFDRLFDPALLPEWKLATNRIEREAAARWGENRPINLDPGYVDGAKLVLASTKNLAHRIYLAQGISAEVTMSFRHGEWVKRDYTFADFKTGRYDAFFSRVRVAHLARLQGKPLDPLVHKGS
jgi:hypothetical protein